MGCPSLDYVYDMTWAEFRIRLHSWKRQHDRELHLIRELAWVTYIAPHQDPKRMKKTKESFWSLKSKGGVKVITDDIRNKIAKAKENYFDEKKKLMKDG